MLENIVNDSAGLVCTSYLAPAGDTGALPPECLTEEGVSRERTDLPWLMSLIDQYQCAGLDTNQNQRKHNPLCRPTALFYLVKWVAVRRAGALAWVSRRGRRG